MLFFIIINIYLEIRAHIHKQDYILYHGDHTGILSIYVQGSQMPATVCIQWL